MERSLDKLNPHPALKTLLQQIFAYLLNDEQMNWTSPFADSIEGPQQRADVEAINTKLESVGSVGGGLKYFI